MHRISKNLDILNILLPLFSIVTIDDTSLHGNVLTEAGTGSIVRLEIENFILLGPTESLHSSQLEPSTVRA